MLHRRLQVIVVLLEILVDGRQHSFQKGVCLTYESIEQRCLRRQSEQLDLLLDVVQSRDCDVDVSNAGLYKCLSLLSVLAFADSVASIGKSDDLVNQTLGHPVKVDEEPTGVGVNIERLVEVLTVVYLLDELDDDV